MLKKLEVPTSSISEVKRSPMDVFQQARDAETGVYIFNREKIAGVMLTQQQYEELVQELAELRSSAPQPLIVEEKEAPETESDSELGTLLAAIKRHLQKGTVITAKNLDEQMVSLGFITKKTGFGGVVDLMKEVKETGKALYHYRGKLQEKAVVAEIISEADNQSQLLDKLVIRRIHLLEK